MHMFTLPLHSLSLPGPIDGIWRWRRSSISRFIYQLIHSIRRTFLRTISYVIVIENIKQLYFLFGIAMFPSVLMLTKCRCETYNLGSSISHIRIYIYTYTHAHTPPNHPQMLNSFALFHSFINRIHLIPKTAQNGHKSST